MTEKPPAAGRGRPKGSRNKTTLAVKEALTFAFEGIGGAPRLKSWAEDNTTEFYKLWAKMLPQDANVSLEATVKGITRKIVDPNA